MRGGRETKKSRNEAFSFNSCRFLNQNKKKILFSTIFISKIYSILMQKSCSWSWSPPLLYKISIKSLEERRAWHSFFRWWLMKRECIQSNRPWWTEGKMIIFHERGWRRRRIWRILRSAGMEEEVSAGNNFHSSSKAGSSYIYIYIYETLSGRGGSKPRWARRRRCILDNAAI